MPRLGWTMEAGRVAAWLKEDGDTVRAGEALFTVESDKAAQEVEALEGGILRIPPESAAPGTAVPVGTVLAYLVQPGEPAPSPHRAAIGDVAAAPADSATTGAPGTPVPQIGTPVPQVTGAPPEPATRRPEQTAPSASPRARRVAQELGVDWRTMTGTGRTGRIVERDVRATAARMAAAAPARVTPLARRLAQDSGVDVEELAAQMPGRRIVRADVAAAAGAAAAPRGGHMRPMSQVRRIIAQRMAQGAHAAAPVTLTTEADATELVRLRQHIRDALAGSERRAPSYTDVLTRLVALALREHPWMNSSLSADTIVQHDAVHMGIAVDTAQGLLVPVVHNAHLKSIQQIAAASARLIEQARAGKAAPDDLRGSTFTITNLGMYDIDAFTPIINLPECAILGVGRIVARPVVRDEDAEKVAVRKMMALSLTFDHRLVDGAPAARFLQHVKRWVEQPYGWLTS
jgi:pyruvate dehydrogenase E2 component (dihydrolipoamide acetyltransferase)